MAFAESSKAIFPVNVTGFPVNAAGFPVKGTEEALRHMVLKDASGKRIGRIEDRGSKQEAYDEAGRKVGEYDKSQDVTRDAHGRRVGQGNLLSTLL